MLQGRLSYATWSPLRSVLATRCHPMPSSAAKFTSTIQAYIVYLVMKASLARPSPRVSSP
jgi:hypothetical protein